MESQKDYYNDMPEGVNVIDKMNEEFAEVQKRNELLEKENDELKRENDEAWDSGFEDGIYSQPGDAGLELLDQRYEEIYRERSGMCLVPPGIAARARTRGKMEAAFLSWSLCVPEPLRKKNAIRREKMRMAFFSWSLWVRTGCVYLRAQSPTFIARILSLRLRAPPPEPESERENTHDGVGYAGRAGSPLPPESEGGEAPNFI